MSTTSALLFVDDEPLALELGAKLLRRIGFDDVDTAPSGVAALALLEVRAYRAVISDWNMPEMNGLDLLHKMRKDERLQRIPFLMTSVDGGFERVRQARKAGVNAFLLKPFDAHSLRAKITEVLGRVPELTRKAPLWPLPEPAAAPPSSAQERVPS